MDNLVSQVESTFSRNVTDESFSETLNELVTYVNNIQVADLNFDPEILEIFSGEDAKARYPPVSGIEILERESFSMDIFILQKGSRIPLHDHPDMYGILKVIGGNVQITSYSEISCDRNDIEIPEDVKEAVNSSKLNSLIPVEVKMSANVTDRDPPCLLTPTEGNYHEIKAVECVAAIFDILSPSYGDREPHYYSVLKSNNLDTTCKIWLAEETDVPNYWCE